MAHGALRSIIDSVAIVQRRLSSLSSTAWLTNEWLYLVVFMTLPEARKTEKRI